MFEPKPSLGQEKSNALSGAMGYLLNSSDCALLGFAQDIINYSEERAGFYCFSGWMAQPWKEHLISSLSGPKEETQSQDMCHRGKNVRCS
jgi:hypothetical protein